MVTNLLKAISNLAQNPIHEIRRHYTGVNRANSMGEALEYYVRDLFCGSVNARNEQERNSIYSANFSYLGNQNNPPDIIIRGGDAIEVKKIESMRSGIALNSSYPKSKLYADSPMITQACRDCESWTEKDIIYAVGVVNRDQLNVLWLVYGDCYAADKQIYERIKNTISSGLGTLEGIELAQTNELGRINRVDPLGITYLRIRGMWHIDNPIRVYDYVQEIPALSNGLSVNVIMKKTKYLAFPDEDKNRLENLSDPRLDIKGIMLKSPNNPANLEEGKLITFRS